jgi:hypothetical protein
MRAPFTPTWRRGRGRTWGVAEAFVALIDLLQRDQIGLLGAGFADFADFAKSTFGIDLPWIVWAFAALLLVGALGVLRVDLSARCSRCCSSSGSSP